MEQLTTYTIKSKNSPSVWQFKYHLNGILAEFKVLDGVLTEKQMKWLSSYFPFLEAWIKDWQGQLSQNFEIIVGDPDLSFAALWELYAYKHAKQDAEKAFKKLKQGDIIKLFTSIPAYKAHLQRTRTAQAHLSTYINGRRFDDEIPESVPIKIDNPMLKQLASMKTEK